MIDVINFHELLRIADMQIQSIVRTINYKADEESRHATEHGLEITMHYFKILENTDTKMYFSIGLKNFMVVKNIFPGQQVGTFNIKTYELYEDYDTDGKIKYNLISGLTISGNTVLCKIAAVNSSFEVRGATEKTEAAGPSYIKYLLNLINTQQDS